jgi:hypothetical protein
LATNDNRKGLSRRERDAGASIDFKYYEKVIIIGMIHVLFWTRFLPSANIPFSALSFVLTFLLTVVQIGLYYPGSM